MATTQITVQEDITTVTVDASTSITITEDITTLELSAALFTTPADAIAYTPYGSVEATTVQAAIDELADDFYKGTTEPGSGFEEGDLFYDTDDNLFRVYVEDEWVTLLRAGDAADMQKLDGGAFQP